MRQGTRIRIALVAALALALPVAGTTAAQAQEKRELVVMTQNLYLGSSLAPALEAESDMEFLLAVADIYGTVVATDFPARAEAIADTIDAERPDLIGLQEVSNWVAVRTTAGAPLPNYDFLAILEAELAARGLDYEVAATSDNANIGPAPLVAPPLGCGFPTFTCFVTLQDRDVILVNADTAGLEWSDPRDGRFAAQETFGSPLGQISFDRGWASIEGTYEGKNFTFVNTHLEVEDSPLVQEDQAREFLAGPARGPAVIAVGDFNSAADGSTTTSYADLTKAWFRDAWSVNPGQAGLTCCQDSDLANPTSELHSRIDLVLTHGAVRPLSAEVVGDTPFQSEPPFWASDHAGVVATVRLH
jgi:endonuclease/exonuclease/phosphatase family metal-dependent hydrolase